MGSRGRGVADLMVKHWVVVGVSEDMSINLDLIHKVLLCKIFTEVIDTSPKTQVPVITVSIVTPLQSPQDSLDKLTTLLGGQH